MTKHVSVFFAVLLLAFVSSLCVSAQPSIQAYAEINSGEANPFLAITSAADITDLTDRVSGLPSAPTPQWNLLGWKGFILFNNGVSLFPSQVTVLDGIVQEISVDGATPQYFRDTKGLENRMYQLMGSMLASANFRPSRLELDTDRGVCVGCTTDFHLPEFILRMQALPTSGSEPPYEPNAWNKVGVQDKNNCYNYACNMMLDSFGRPGRQSGMQPPTPGMPGYSCNDTVGPPATTGFISAAKGDGLTVQNCDNACPKGSFKVALVVDPKGGGAGVPPDYHWYRQDNNGDWSHKPGNSEVTNLDSGGNKITDPRTAGRDRRNMNGRVASSYSDFCSCFCVDPTKIKIK